VDFRILGPLEVLDGSRAVPVGGPRKRGVLGILLLNPNRAISVDRLIEELWGDRPPATALQTVRVHVSQLRKMLGRDVVRTLSAGYVLQVDPERVDAHRFERLVGDARGALAVDDASSAAALLRDALALWRGPALADFTYEPFAQAEIARLEDLRVAATEARMDAELALGGGSELVDTLETLVAEHPLRERFRAQLMLALYRAGRQSDALGAYRAARETLVEEVGLEPGAELRELEAAILRHDPSLGAHAVAVAHATTSSLARKTVTILHVAIGAGDAAVDPEALARRLERPREQALLAVGRHEGTVVSEQAGSVTAAFGLPSLHEDDALRAVRAAVELRDDLQVRIGVATGEVVASEATRPVGAVAGSAAALAEAAAPGEIALDGATHALVANAVEVAPTTDPGVVRLETLLPGAPPFARRLETPLVGRRAELDALVAGFERVLATRRPELVVVAGPPGIGKSRLAGELVHEVADRATALVGRCLSYGRGITLWPLRELVRETVGDETRDSLAALLRDEEDGAVVADRVAGALGTAQTDASAEETVWAFRRLFETLARRRPHVLVVEDVHWAEPALLDLLDHVAEHADPVPFLIVCLARPDLLESRPAWAGAAIELEPLSADEIAAQIDLLPGGRTLDAEVRRRVVAVAEGNPLFAEQFVALLAANGGSPIPATAPTIHAILAARLDQLGPAERVVAECAAVVGREFTLEAVVTLLPRGAVTGAPRHLDALSRKVLVQPDRAVLQGQKGYRFQHALVHDAAYRRLPKQRRAELHERLADWLERDAEQRAAELEEIVGYHLERAHGYRVELGLDDSSTGRLAARAAALLGSAGRRAFQRTDFGAAVGLLTRALALMAEDDPATVELLNVCGTALGPLGEAERQEQVLAEALSRARLLGDVPGEWHARLEGHWLADLTADPDEIRADAETALRAFEQAGDAAGATRACSILSILLREAGLVSAAEAEAERALDFARASGVSREEIRAQWLIVGALLDGPRPVAAAIERCGFLLEEASESVVGTVGANWGLGILRALNGEFDAARAHVGRARAVIEGIAHPRPLVTIALAAGRVELLAGDVADAAARYEEGLLVAEEFGIDGSTLARSLVEVLCLQRRPDEAVRRLRDLREPQSANVLEVARWSIARARVCALSGDFVEAQELAETARTRVAATDLLPVRAEAAQAYAEVLAAEGRSAEAADALAEAVRLYERKGAVAAAAQARRAVPLYEPA
jgi:DNA-binding SARP family transcriptional activator/tetratricopeptide (TPR) repeat protein